MRPKFNKDGIVLYQGDCREVMSELAPSSIDTIITDPPYHLTQTSRNGSPRKSGTGPFGRIHVGERGFMGRTWDGGSIAFDPEMWATVLRVAKPGAFLLAFGGTRTFHRLACALEEAGWIIRDCIMWLYGSGFPKSWDISKAIDRAAGIKRNRIGISSGPNHSRYSGERYRQKRSTRFGTVQDQPDLTAPSTSAAKEWNGWGTGLKPAWEPIIVAMKPLDGTFARNAVKHGVAGMWIDGVRIGTFQSETPSGFDRYNIRLAEQGYRPNEYQKGKPPLPTAQGRWPANVLLDEEASTMLDEQSGERPAGGAPQRRVSPKTDNAYGEYGMACPPGIDRSTGGASRFFYCAKASWSERNAGLSGMPARKELIGAAGHTTNPTTGKPVVDIPRANHHPTVKPLKLMEYLCKLTKTPTGGIILDPFAGSGSTLIAARNVGRACVGIESDLSYVRIAKARLQASTRAQEVKGVPTPQAA